MSIDILENSEARNAMPGELNMQHETIRTDLFFRIADHLADGDTLDEVLASVVNFAVALVKCDECCTYVREGTELVPWVWKSVSHGSLQRPKLPVDRGFAAALSFHRAPVAGPGDSANSSAFRVFNDWSNDPGETFIGIPFLSRSSLMGAITLRHWQPRPYANLELQFLSSIGHLLGAELRLSHLHKEKSNLLPGLETRKLVERGKGILQRDLGLSEHEALLALQHQSQQKKRPMKEIARAIILNAEVRQSVVQPE